MGMLGLIVVVGLMRRGTEGILICSFESSSLADCHVPRIVVTGEHQLVRAAHFQLLLAGYSRTGRVGEMGCSHLWAVSFTVVLDLLALRLVVCSCDEYNGWVLS